MNTAPARIYRPVFFIGLVSLAFLCATACRKSAAPSAQTPPEGSGDAPRDVCGLLKSDELEAVIGSPIKDTKASGQSNSGFRVSQCYYAAGESAKSVSLSVTERDPASDSNRGGNQYWEETFGRYENANASKETEANKAKRESLNEQKRGKGEEEEGAPPKKVDGVGDEAFWSGNRVGGALYVLDKKKDAFVRVSVGGADTEEKKIEKSKALAEKALGRL